jgi:hypothetical protein
MLKKRKLEPTQPVHDRRSTDLLANARVVPVIVDDPLEAGAKLVVMRSTRDDVLAEMLSRGEIDQAQFDAGRKYERYAEQAEIGSIQAIDPRKEAVDGGGGFEGITDRQIDAVRQLSEAARVLGLKGEGLVRFVLISRRPFSALGLERRQTDRARTKFFTYLEILAEHWGCAMRHTPRG